MSAAELPFLEKVADYYSGKVEDHGPTAAGVDWNSAESQRLRFAELLRLCADRADRFSILDYGCGYGALASYLREQGFAFDYQGFDISEAMLERARELHPELADRFTSDPSAVRPADYAVASGVLNVKLDTPSEAWERYVLETVDRLASLSREGFAFNALTSYSDPERMRPDLHYSDPCALFHHCKIHYSRWVALAHDYGLYEFTIRVLRRGEPAWRSS